MLVKENPNSSFPLKEHTYIFSTPAQTWGRDKKLKYAARTRWELMNKLILGVGQYSAILNIFFNISLAGSDECLAIIEICKVLTIACSGTKIMEIIYFIHFLSNAWTLRQNWVSSFHPKSTSFLMILLRPVCLSRITVMLTNSIKSLISCFFFVMFKGHDRSQNSHQYLLQIAWLLSPF